MVLQEILDFQDSKRKIAYEIWAKFACLCAFSYMLKDAKQVLDVLLDDYVDYPRPQQENVLRNVGRLPHWVREFKIKQKSLLYCCSGSKWGPLVCKINVITTTPQQLDT